ncbi:MAG: hypothetical protein SNJ78_01235 [Spirochaetales bacterium]
MSNNLQKIWTEYRKTGKGSDALIRAIVLFVYRFPLCCNNCTEEDCASFLLSFYSRIPFLIEHYQEHGKGFEAYLKSCLKWHLKTYLKSRFKESQAQKILLEEYKIAPNCRVKEDGFMEEIREPVYPLTCHTTSKKVKKDFEGKKLLLLSLKAAYDLEDPSIEKIADCIGIHKEVFFHLIEVSRSTLLTKEERIKELSEKRDLLFFRITTLQNELHRCTKEECKVKLEKRLCHHQKMYRSLMRKIRNIHLSPSNKKLAEILGMPKGSIDSTLYYLKKGTSL